MTNQHRDEEAIFLAALERQNQAERNAFVEEACADRQDLLERVRELLGSHDESRGPLDAPIASLNATLDQPLTEKSGAQIGPYKLLQQIGEGGMGVVYLAEQKVPVKRRVALKIIKPGMDTRQVISRFEAERQALAMMDHPNIAKVLDAGATESGRPYFVMELVNGLPVTRYCDEQHLTPKERLELFVPICQAVQHAHQKGIIHRDLKPSNILIALYDGRAVPKIIDFGVAKATSQTLTEKTMFTQLGQVVGTLEYMSPEQAERNQLDIDTRSDIYSLGVVLYELLTGETPFDRARLRSAAFDEILRIIREEEPSKPSTKVSSSQSLPSIAANRRIEPAKLGSMIRGELDWIILKAMEKDRGRRYDTANGLARDIQRYLADEIVEARPPSTGYRLKKFVKRYKAQVIAASLLLLALIGGIAGTSYGLYRAHASARAEHLAKVDAENRRIEAEKQKSRAEEREQQAIAAAKRFGDVVSQNPELRNNPALQPLRKTLLKEPLAFFQTLRKRLQASDDTRPEALARLASAGFDLGELTNAIGDKQDALRLFEESRTLYERLAGKSPAVTEYAERLARSHTVLGLLQMETGRSEAAEASFGRALAIFERLARENPDVTGYARNLAESHDSLGILQQRTGRAKEAEATHGRVIAIYERLARENPDDTELASRLAGSHNNLGILQLQTGRSDAAEASFGRVIAINERLARENPEVTELASHLADSHNNLGVLQAQTGRAEAAEATYARAIGILDRLARENPAVTDFAKSLASGHTNLGNLQGVIGRPEAAEASYGRALAIQERLARENPAVTDFARNLANNHINLGDLQAQTGRAEAAEASFGRALAIFERLARENPDATDFTYGLSSCLTSLGLLQMQTGRSDAARTSHGRALTLNQKLAHDHPESPIHAGALGAALHNLANLDNQSGRLGEARERYEQAIVWQRKALGVDPRNPEYRQLLTDHLTNLARVCQRLKDSTAAAEAQRQLAEFQADDPRFAPLTARLDAIAHGESVEDNAERLRLAERAYEIGRYALATRLMDEALQGDPKLAVDRLAQHRYNAACAATLAGSGWGDEAPKPDEAAQAKLRAQALGWLQAELSAWKRASLVIEPGNQELVAKTLEHWKQNLDLASIRDSEELAKLPEGEQKDWQTLWSDVDALLERTQGTKP